MSNMTRRSKENLTNVNIWFIKKQQEKNLPKVLTPIKKTKYDYYNLVKKTNSINYLISIHQKKKS